MQSQKCGFFRSMRHKGEAFEVYFKSHDLMVKVAHSLSDKDANALKEELNDVLMKYDARITHIGAKPQTTTTTTVSPDSTSIPSSDLKG